MNFSSMISRQSMAFIGSLIAKLCRSILKEAIVECPSQKLLVKVLFSFFSCERKVASVEDRESFESPPEAKFCEMEALPSHKLGTKLVTKPCLQSTSGKTKNNHLFLLLDDLTSKQDGLILRDKSNFVVQS